MILGVCTGASLESARVVDSMYCLDDRHSRTRMNGDMKELINAEKRWCTGGTNKRRNGCPFSNILIYVRVFRGVL